MGDAGKVRSEVQRAVVRARPDRELVVIARDGGRWKKGGRDDNSEHVFVQPKEGLGCT